MVTDLNKLAREIIEQNQYITFATSDANGHSWVSILVYAYDDAWNFYFVSIPDSRHCLNARINNKVAIAIFDSRQKLSEGVGLQIEGVIKEIKITEVPKVAAIYFKRKYPYGKMPHIFNTALKNFLKKKLYHFYRITPTKVWMNDPNSKIDVRVEIDLNN